MERVKVEYKNDVAYVSMNRPAKYNGLDWDMFKAMIKTAWTLRFNRDIRAVILSGEGDVFCAGLDFGSTKPWMIPALLFKGVLSPTNMAQEIAFAWRRIPVPVIAVVHGKCLGGGFQIAMGADFRIAQTNTDFSILEAKWGLIPDMSITVTTRQLAPIDKLKELTMTGRFFDAQEAKELNLVTYVDDDPMAKAEALVEEIRARSPDSVSYSKRLFERTRNASDRCAFFWESHYQTRLFMLKNTREVVSKTMAKKTPKFSRRGSLL